MKKLVTTLCALAALSALAASAFAAPLVVEPFAYPDGNLTQAGSPWTTFSGTLPIDIQVISGRAVGNNTNAPDDQIAFTAQPLTSSTYACFNVVIPDPGGAPKGNYFAMLKDAGTSAFFSRVFVLPLAGGGFTFGISFSSVNATTGPVLWSATPLAYGQPYSIVIKYDPVALTSTMWVNPSSEASPSVSQTGTGTGIAISTFALRQSSTAATLPTGYATGTVNFLYSVDDLGVGPTFADACGQPVPSRASTWGRLKSIYR
jgi:hypothetical protein